MPETSASTPNYLIIGLGFSAIVNHLTLRLARNARIEGLEVRHVAGPEPWYRYANGKMGQWPALLELPGFTPDYSKESPDEFLTVEAFRECLRKELEDMKLPDPYLGTVTGIEFDGYDGYVAKLREGDHEKLIPAAKIDVCTGGGAIRYFSGKMPDDLREEYQAFGDWKRPRRVLPG